MNEITPEVAKELLVRLSPGMFSRFPQNCDKADQTDMRRLENEWVFEGWAYAEDIAPLPPKKGTCVCLFERHGNRQWCQIRALDLAEIGWRYLEIQGELARQASKAGTSF